MYVAIGKIMGNEILINNNALFFVDDTTYNIVLVRKINGNGTRVRDGYIYSVSDVEFDEELNFYDINTIKTLLDLGLLKHDYEYENGDIYKWFLLSELLQLSREIPEEIYEIVYQDGMLIDSNGYDLSALLSLVKNVNALKWILNKGISFKNVPGWGNSLENILSSAMMENNSPIIDEICNYPELLDVEYLSGEIDNCIVAKKLLEKTKNESIVKLCNLAIRTYDL